MVGIRKILIANRGEIAVRIIRACRELGIKTIAAYSTADKNSLFTKIADEKICIGNEWPENSYLNIFNIVSAAQMLQADAIHPGIGFLAENAWFADICMELGITFIGPGGDLIRKMGNKSTAKIIAGECGLPVIAGSNHAISNIEDCRQEVGRVGIPCVLKAVSGGGGKGIRVIHDISQTEKAFALCQKESLSAFGDNEIMVEKYISRAKHIEVQLLADTYGNMIHLGERECTIQREKQKIVEETPSPNISDKLKQRLFQEALKLAKHIHYVGPGTVEFMVLPNEEFYFLEMNTRLQVEHTITEMITDIDLVKQQIMIFSGAKLRLRQRDVSLKKYALQCRVLAESSSDLSPSCGKIQYWNMPDGLGIRVDSGYVCMDEVTPYYDSLLAKICCVAASKEEAVNKMSACLNETIIKGLETNLELLKYLLQCSRFTAGDYYTEDFIPELLNAYAKELQGKSSSS